MGIKARDWVLQAFSKSLTDAKSLSGPSQVELWALLVEELIAAGGQSVEKYIGVERERPKTATATSAKK